MLCIQSVHRSTMYHKQSHGSNTSWFGRQCCPDAKEDEQEDRQEWTVMLIKSHMVPVK